MELTVIREESVITSHWAGGESKQYYIYPPTSSYSNRDFLFRLSMATSTTDEEVKYSNLENFTRYLVMLEGTSQVFHKGYYNIIMTPYKEIDIFDGGWESSGIGKVTDFNMMLSKGIKGKMTVIDNSGNHIIGQICEVNHMQYNKIAFYCGQGTVNITLSADESVMLNKGDLLLIEDFVPNIIDADIQLTDAKLIRMDICCY